MESIPKLAETENESHYWWKTIDSPPTIVIISEEKDIVFALLTNPPTNLRNIDGVTSYFVFYMD